MNTLYRLLCLAVLLIPSALPAATEHKIVISTSNKAAVLSGPVGSQTLLLPNQHNLVLGPNLVLEFSQIVMAPGSKLVATGSIAAIGGKGFSSGGHFRLGLLDSNMRGPDRGWLGYIGCSWGIPKSKNYLGFFGTREMANNGPWESIGKPGESYMSVLSTARATPKPIPGVDRYAFTMILAYDGKDIHYTLKVTPQGDTNTMASYYEGVDTQVRTSAFDRCGFYIGQVPDATGLSVEDFALTYFVD